MATTTVKPRLKRQDETVEFTPEDFDVMNLALGHNQELRLCAQIVKAARLGKTSYPLQSSKPLLALLKKRSVFIEGHHINGTTIDRYMVKEYFPIENEEELLARCYVALMRCQEDARWADRAPEYAASLLKEMASIKKSQGGA